MARRRKEDDTERRTQRLGVPLTPTEQAELRNRAAKVFGDDPNVSEYARLILLSDCKSPPPSSRDPRLISQLVVALNRLGNNINQLAHVANAIHEIPSERVLREVSAQIVEALEKVIAL